MTGAAEPPAKPSRRELLDTKLLLEAELLRKQAARADKLHYLALLRLACWCIIGVSGIVVAAVFLLRSMPPS